MKLKIKAWLNAFRLRTLPLAFSSIITGSSLALFYEPAKFSIKVLVLCFVTTLLLQVLSNLANDYGDSQKGTDNNDRIGPQRAIQSGALSFAEMKIGIIVTVVLSLVAGVWLIVEATRNLNVEVGLFFLTLGVAAIAAAIKYTVGKNPYGYYGLGDLFVFLFFGWVGVCGSFYLQAHSFNVTLLLPASAIGLWATTVLHLNNMRDRISDEKAGKITMAVRLGFANSKYYFYLLNLLAILCMCCFFIAAQIRFSEQLVLYVGYIAFVVSCIRVYKIQNPAEFDPLLKRNALATFVYALLMAIML
jgi:1,4-dihydroxy-2-naphthoate octaprenyltransferase